MPEYTITFARSARKELERLSSRVVRRVFPAIEALARDPRPLGCRKLQGVENLWRVRVGDYRVIYQVLDDELVVDIVAVRHRGQAYKLK
ncbi:MAG: type II toxin-antitoxin system RelE/ParE family toxin [Chloroflexi bacterium]|nr:type II toxin-antitoxin system RelE/ParE family toxin [Chloroflexota bacterium]MBU1750347.1 type II toxin-antitoxin system RelE/ParE family toxin [Chloroflexota bacterium]